MDPARREALNDDLIAHIARGFGFLAGFLFVLFGNGFLLDVLKRAETWQQKARGVPASATMIACGSALAGIAWCWPNRSPRRRLFAATVFGVAVSVFALVTILNVVE